MIELERHIEILLLSNDCVIVPGLGGFMAHYVEARYDETDGTFLPPLRTLGFNPQLQLNDHLLVQSYIEAYDISYPEALRRVENEVKELRQHLDANGFYELNDIGTLRLNDEGNMTFEPCEAGILTPALYGFGSFEMLPIGMLPKTETEVTAIVAEPAIDDAAADILEFSFPDDSKPDNTDSDAITIRMSWVRNAIAVAAAVVAFFLISTPVSNSHFPAEVQQSSILPMAKSEATPQPQPITTEGTTTEAPTDSIVHAESTTVLATQEEAIAPYVIVLASQTTRHHADNFVSRLAKEGHTDARIMAMANSSMVRVVCGAFTSEAEAHDQLRQLRALQHDIFSEAWIMKSKQQKDS